MVQQTIDKSTCGSSSFGCDSCVAARMGPLQRRELFLEALRRSEPILRLAERHHISRKFVYQQMAKATAAVDQAFQAPVSPVRSSRISTADCATTFSCVARSATRTWICCGSS